MTNLPAKIDAGPVVRIEREKVKTTLFWDMHSGGVTTIEPFNKIYIECPEKLARIYFTAITGENPDSVRCSCCGENYSVSESDDIEQSTGYHRDADGVYYDGSNGRYIRDDGFKYRDSDGREVSYDRDWDYLYEGGADLVDYLNREDVLFVPAATVAAWFIENGYCADGSDYPETALLEDYSDEC